MRSGLFAYFLTTAFLISCGGGSKLGGDTGDATPDRSDPLTDSADVPHDRDAADTADVPPPPCPSGEWGDLIFEFQADDTIVSTPAIGDDGTIYFGTQSATLYAVDCFGNKKWEWPMDCGDFCPQAFEGSPAIGGDGTIYIGDDIAVPNYAFALSPGGDMLWRYETHVVYGQMDASPVIASDGTIFFGAHGDSGYVGPIGQLVALDTDGNVYDGFPMETKAIRRSPAADGNVIYVSEVGSTEGHAGPFRNAVFAATRQDHQLWRTELSTSEPYVDLAISAVAIDKEGNITVVENISLDTPLSVLVLINPSTHSVEREIELSRSAWSVASPIVGPSDFGEDIIVALTNGQLMSINPNSGGVIFTFEIDLGDHCRGAPLLSDDGHIFATADAMVFRLSKQGEHEGGPNPVEVSGIISSSLAISTDGILYMGTENGRIIAVASGAGGLDREAPWPAYRHDDRNTGNAATVIRD